MNAIAYAAFKATQNDPIEKWESILAATTDPEVRRHMQIALDARRRLEAAKANEEA